MKRFLTILLATVSSFMVYGQCPGVQVAVTGSNTSASANQVATPGGLDDANGCAELDGANATIFEWTAPGCGDVTVESCNDPAGTDTELIIFTGDCSVGGTFLVAENDDAGCGVGTTFGSSATFTAAAGVTYLIAWGDQWDPLDFQFDITFTAGACPNDPCVGGPATVGAPGEVCIPLPMTITTSAGYVQNQVCPTTSGGAAGAGSAGSDAPTDFCGTGADGAGYILFEMSGGGPGGILDFGSYDLSTSSAGDFCFNYFVPADDGVAPYSQMEILINGAVVWTSPAAGGAADAWVYNQCIPLIPGVVNAITAQVIAADFNEDLGIDFAGGAPGGSTGQAGGVTACVSSIPVDISDPCGCFNPLNVLGPNGVDLFHEQITINTGVTGEVWTLNTGTNVLDMTGAPLPLGATVVPEVPAGSGIYVLDLYTMSGPYTAGFNNALGVPANISGGCDVTDCCTVVCPGDFTFQLSPGECAAIVPYTVATEGICTPCIDVSAGVASTNSSGVIDDSVEGVIEIETGDSGIPGDTQYTFPANSCPGDVIVTFDWTYDTNDGATWDEFYVEVDGVQTAIVDSGANNQAGTSMVTVPSGSVLAFNGFTVDGTAGPATIVISNIQLNPPPSSPLVPTLTTGFESGEEFPIGTTTVTYEVLSADGIGGPFFSECSFEVEVTPFLGAVESIACNDHVNISLDENCEVEIGADMFLEGGPYECYDNYTVTINGTITVVPGTPLSLPCGDHTVMVTSPNGNPCWGTFTIEDKLAPTIEGVSDITVTCIDADCVPAVLSPAVEISGGVTAFEGVTLNAASQDFVLDLTNSPCATVTDLNVLVNITTNNGFDYSVDVTAPSGNTYTVASVIDGCGGINMLLDDDAPSTLTCADVTSGAPNNINPFFGQYADLTSIEGENMQGVWTISISDGGGADNVFNEITLFFNEGDTSCDIAATPPVPSPILCDCQSYSFTDSESLSDCTTGTITRTWTCVDKAGNTSAPVVQTIFVEPLSLDGLGSTWFVPPAILELPCGTGTSPWDIANFYDNWIDTDGDGILDTPDAITDDCPNSDPDCPDVYEFEEGIVMGFPFYFAEGCNSACNAKNTTHPQPIDNNICNLFSSYVDTEIPACGVECPGNIKVIRQWTVLDWCNSSTIPYTQIIKSTDLDAPEITAPDITLSVNPWGCVASGPLPAPEHLYDECAKPGDLTYTVSGPVPVISLDGSGNPPYGLIGAPKGVHTFTYTAADCCGNVGTGTMTVTVVDDTPPVAIAKEAIVVSLTSGGSDESGYAKILPVHIDNGSHDGDCGPVRLEIRRPSGAPMCGNVGNNGYNNNVTFNDNQDPQDNNSDTDGGQWVKFCCDDLSAGNTYTGPDGQIVSYQDSMPVILRVWDDGNCDGTVGGAGDNYNETWAYVQVENKLPPVILCPPDATIGCDMDWTLHLDGQAAPTETELAILTAPDFGTGIATGAGVCGGVSVTYSDRYNEDICYTRNNEITRTWCIEGTNTCCEQKIDISTVIQFDPLTISLGNNTQVIVNPPSDIFEACVDGSGAALEPSWINAPCELIGWTMHSDTFQIEGEACIKIINDYTVVNWCTGDEWMFTQVIKVIDDEDPDLVVEPLCVAVNADCVAPVGTVQLKAVATDSSEVGACVSPWLKWEVLVDINGDWTYDHIFSSYVSPQDPNFGTNPNEYYVAPTAPGEGVCLTIPVPLSGSKYDHRAVWKVSDGCGNITSTTTTFQVTDKKAPTPYCQSVSSALMAGDEPMLELWACDYVLDGITYDNCTPNDWMRFTFSETAPEDLPQEDPGDGSEWFNAATSCSAITYTCDDIGGANSGVVSVDVYFWDECGNYDFCTVELTLNGPCEGDPDGTGRIAGDVGTEYGDMVENVTVSITSNQPEYPMTINTDASGTYDSNGHDYNYDYALNAYKNDDPRNGVSTLDIVLIQRHILNLQNLSSAYQYIAADANSDQNITAADLVDIRKLILEVTDEYPNNDSWRFVDANQALTTANAFAFNETLDILSLNANMLAENWVAVKIGDVNGNAVVNAQGNDAEFRTGANLAFTLAGEQTAEGIKVDVTSANFNDIAGYQFTMNTNGLSLTNVESGALELTDENVAVIDDNTITMSWNTLTAKSVASEVLFTLYFAGNETSLVDGMSISSDVTNAEAYDNELNIMNVVLGEESAAEFALYQNEPNPFETQTTIEFSLPTAGQATLQVMDVTGKLVKQITNTYAKGVNSIVLSKNEIGVSGVLYYTLESGDYSATKKMIIIE